MNDLKGRISSLKIKAQEDQLRRRSMQSLRTSSPFTNAQEWYSGSDTYNANGAPVTANAGLGITTESPTRRVIFEEDHDHQGQDDNELEATAKDDNTIHEHSREIPYHGVEDKDFDDLESYDDEKDFDDGDEGDFMSVNGDDAELGGDSVYEDAVYEMSATERHEDRIDAFDYEHFFLHSAMGTYGLDGRRSSTGSDSSTATTRPVTAVQVQDDDDDDDGTSSIEKRVSLHARNDSSASISTIASFATAAEEQDDDEANEQMDQFSQHILSHQRPMTSNGFTSLRADSAINLRRATMGSPPSQTTVSRGSASPVDLASGLQVSKIFSILTESSSPGREGPRLALSEEEKQLIYSLAASFQQVCSGLLYMDGERYERKAWRRRLDDARRVLNGEGLEDDDSF